jgi:hypothetical protein
MTDRRETDRRVRTGEWLVTFTGAVLLLSAGVKILHPVKAVNYMAFLGYLDEKLFLIAAIELITAMLFLYRRPGWPARCWYRHTSAARSPHISLTIRWPARRRSSCSITTITTSARCRR